MRRRIVQNLPRPEPRQASSRTNTATHLLGTLLPTWILRWGLAAVFAFGISALAMAMAGFFSLWTVTPIGVLSTLWVGRRLPSLDDGKPIPWAVGLAVVLVAVAVCAYGWIAPHEHIVTGRDSGTYFATSAWIADEGSLFMDVGDPVLEETEVVYDSIGFFPLDDGDDLRPQFLHVWPSLMAYGIVVSSDVHGAFLVAPLVAAVGLLAMFAFARKLLSDGVALFATILFTASLPFAYFYRAPFSETLAFTFLFGGLWVLEEARLSHSLSLATVAGVLIGAVAVVRIDGVVVLLGLTAYHMLVKADTDGTLELERSRLNLIERAWRASALMFVVAALEGAVFAPHYISDHGSLIAAVLAVILALRLLSAPLGRIYQRHKATVANVVTALTGAFFGYAGLLRPHTEEPTQANIYGIERLQIAAGVPVEPLRSYAEMSVHWLLWYLGILLVVLGLAGLVLGIRRVLMSPDTRGGAFLTMAAVFAILYVYRPSINPDHIWAMRRFLPLVIPALVVLALLLAAKLTSGLGRWRIPAMFVLGASMIVPISISTARAGLGSEFSGAADALSEACDTLGDGNLLVFLGESARTRLSAFGPSLRGACGLTVAAENPDAPLSAESMASLSAIANAGERHLWWVGEAPENASTTTLFDNEYPYLEMTLFEAPTEWEQFELRLSSWRGDP